jgi:hypothetical protein
MVSTLRSGGSVITVIVVDNHEIEFEPWELCRGEVDPSQPSDLKIMYDS